MTVKSVIVSPKVQVWAKKRKIQKQLQKAINYILEGDYKSVALKPRQPKSSWIYYFRINKQFRAICEKEGNTLIIYAINNHQ